MARAILMEAAISQPALMIIGDVPRGGGACYSLHLPQTLARRQQL